MGKRGERLQADVLCILRQRAEPLSAYDILAELKKTHGKMAPTTVYRTLAALSEDKQVHRLESLNAYVVCQADCRGHPSVLSICDDCGAVEENIAPDLLQRLSSLLGESGFAAKRHIIEVHGLCASCGSEPSTS